MRKLRKTVALFLALAMMLSMGAMAAENEEESRLWIHWTDLNWEEEEPTRFVPDETYYEGFECLPGETPQLVFYTAKGVDKDGQPKDPTPVKAENLVGSKGVTLTPLTEDVAKNDPLAGCYVEVTVDQRDKNYTISYDGAVMTFSSYLPDIGIYDAPVRSHENFVERSHLYVNPAVDNTVYILSDTDMEFRGRTVASLELAKDKDGITDMAVLKEVGEGAYSLSLTGDDLPTWETENRNIHILLTWEPQEGDPYTEDFYVWCDPGTAVRASESAILDGTKEVVPAPDEKLYSTVADKLSDTVTMAAGEDKTVYLTIIYAGASGWTAGTDSSVFFTTSDALLDMKVDSTDGTKYTLSCDVPGEYEIGLAWDFHYYFLDEDGSTIPGGPEEDAVIEELDKLWGGVSWGAVPTMDGEDIIFWDFDHNVELDCPYETVIERGSELNEYVSSIKVIVEGDVADVYSDVPAGQWYVDAVKFVTSKGMMTGSNGKFNPNSNITGAEFVQIMYNIADRPAPAEDAAFEGVSEKDWYANAVLWAAGEGLITDTGDSALDPTAPLTREQMFNIFYKCVGGDEKKDADLSVFTDAEEVSAWALDAVNWAVNNSVTDGVGNGKFAPADSTNRAGVAAMLMKYYSK